MRRALAVLLLALPLAACGDDDEPPAEDEAVVERPEASPFYVGRWAAEEALCQGGAWVFSESGVDTAGEVSCTFTNVAEVETGYAVQAICTADGDTSDAVINLSYAESAQALLIEGGPWQPIGLIRCPD
ncbi:MAG: hypothetical protein KIS96_09350 [Bauldia sp.]|nr:hypothetical protein [Bauldia sp.]